MTTLLAAVNLEAGDVIHHKGWRTVRAVEVHDGWARVWTRTADGVLDDFDFRPGRFVWGRRRVPVVVAG